MHWRHGPMGRGQRSKTRIESAAKVSIVVANRKGQERNVKANKVQRPSGQSVMSKVAKRKVKGKKEREMLMMGGKSGRGKIIVGHFDPLG